jgi:hypothetical protein
VVGKANQAVREMRDMVRNYGLETGITIGMPGSTSWVNPSGGMTMSVAGIIATF